MNKILRLLKKPKFILLKLLHTRFFRIISDENYVKLEYYLNLGRKLDLNKPKRYNDKLQWLKLNDRKDIYTEMVDKFAVRNIVEKTIGKEYLIPLLGVYNDFDEINFEELPSQFVLKPNHTSGNVYICRNKSEINYNQLRRKVDKWMKRDYFWEHREWPYKNVDRKLVIEKLMVDESGTDLKDYKFFCFNGDAKFMFVAKDRSTSTKFNFYDSNFNKLPLKQHYPNFNDELKKPISFEKMKYLAGKLSEGIPHVRVDFYEINGEIYFGELTFYHFAGVEQFEPDEWDFKFGDLIEL
ncbi:ATP-grasp fold amidoligase family protein [Aerococcus urinaeequi]|uniref:ATP-grasp fold amidoligase family protein n=1 Tax=Aerococcus urinaeequi TaxID=51665 RepID=A0AA47J360_9LACT|nr:ATP-grasp fold amidoligase family protein [Aerococcus urinaeequi]WAT23981.1 ATP-grasp fold amidoligase family protein [Aerococcus urinaeequi]